LEDKSFVGYNDQVRDLTQSNYEINFTNLLKNTDNKIKINQEYYYSDTSHDSNNTELLSDLDDLDSNVLYNKNNKTINNKTSKYNRPTHSQRGLDNTKLLNRMMGEIEFRENTYDDEIIKPFVEDRIDRINRIDKNKKNNNINLGNKKNLF
jgi:hypothetical protein